MGTEPCLFKGRIGSPETGGGSNLLWSFVSDFFTNISIEETFLQDFLVILKRKFLENICGQ